MKPTLHLDTSALVKLYVRESGTDEMIAAAQEHGLRILSLARVEMASAVWRRQRDGDMSEAEADGLMRRLKDDCATTLAVVPTTDAILDVANRLVRRHALRAYDAVQLAGALQSAADPDALVFVAADGSLLAAARHEMLRTWNPTTSPDPG